jgi:four helix bundle protein
MARPQSYRELIVWQKAMALARRVYTVGERFPKGKAFGLLSQMRRAAVSIASNIAEGYGRLTDMQFRHFPGNARGSLYEMQTQLELAADPGYLDKETEHQLMEQGAEVARLIKGLLTAQRTGANSGSPSANPASSANTANSAKAHVS